MMSISLGRLMTVSPSALHRLCERIVVLHLHAYVRAN